MKLFGEFLIEKGLITESDLLASVIEQINSTPNLAGVIYKDNLIDQPSLLKALKYQVKSGKSFKQACVDLGFWSKTIGSQVERAIENVRLPLGQLLIEKKLLTTEQLTQSLQEYVAESHSKKEKEETALPLDKKDMETLSHIWNEKLYQSLLKCIAENQSEKFHSYLKSLYGLFEIFDMKTSKEICKGLEKTQDLSQCREPLEKLWALRNDTITSGGARAA